MGDSGHEAKAPFSQGLHAHGLPHTELTDGEEEGSRGTSLQSPSEARQVIDAGVKTPPQPLLPGKEQPDELLVMLAKQGSREAFEILVERYMPAIQRHIRRASSIGDDEIIADLTQETFLKAWKSLPMHNPKRTMNFRPWLYRVAITSTADYFRKYKLEHLFVSLEERGEKAAKQSSWVQRVEDDLCRHESIVAALNQMYPQYRQCLVMRYVEEYSFQEIAQALNINEVTVRVNISRGRDQFKQAYLREMRNNIGRNNIDRKEGK